MLGNQTIEILRKLRLSGMVQTYIDQLNNPIAQSLMFDDRFGLLVDGERIHREKAVQARLLARAKLKAPNACGEDIDFSAARGLDKAFVLQLLTCHWIEQCQHLLVTGPTGVGKTWLSCVFGFEAARKGLSVLYQRLPRLLEDLAIAHDDGSLPQLRTKLAKAKLLILDDWGVTPLSDLGRQDLLEVIDDRVPGSSLLITSQLPVSKWHEYLGEPTIADAILDRIVHSSHRIALKGESMRKRKPAS